MRLHQLASNRSVSAPCCIDRSQEWIFSRSTIAKVAGNYLWKLRRLTSRNYKLLRDRANKLSLFHAAVRAGRARVQRQVNPVLCLMCFVIQDLLLYADSYSTPGEDLDEWAKRVICSYTGITKNVRFSVCVRGRGSNQTLGSFWTKFAHARNVGKPVQNGDYLECLNNDMSWRVYFLTKHTKWKQVKTERFEYF